MVIDLIILTIFVTVFITGFIRGAGIELLRVLKIIIPFIVLYYFGDWIVQKFFGSNRINHFVYSILPNIPYKATLSALSTRVLLYAFVYLFLAIFLWRLGKYVLDERIEYFFGKTNALMGGIFSVLRMYVIISYLIIPFYLLNFTNQTDYSTNFILNYPPPFSKIGHFINDSRQTLDKINDVSASFKVMDLDGLTRYTALLTDVEAFMGNLEEKSARIEAHLVETDTLPPHTESNFLMVYLYDFDTMQGLTIRDREMNDLHREVLHEVEKYEEVIKWIYREEVLHFTTFEEVVESFINNYNQIVEDTDDPLTVDVLLKTKSMTQIYLLITSFLDDHFGIDVKSTEELLNDANLQLLLETYHLHHDALIDQLMALEITQGEKETIKKQIEKFQSFQTDYLTIYRPHLFSYQMVLRDVDFKYQLAFSIMKEHGFNQNIYEQLSNNPTMYLFILDSIPVLDRLDKEGDVYLQAGQVFTSLFLLSIDEEGTFEPITADQLIQQLFQHDYLQAGYDVDTPLREVIRQMLIPREEGSYMEHLLQHGYLTIETLEEVYGYPNIESSIGVRNTLHIKAIIDNHYKGVEEG